MKFWTDKSGKELTFKEFLQRWRNGLEKVTPLQQVNLQINATFIIIIGLCSGIVISIIGIKTLWWLMLILIGGLFNTVVQMLGLWQKKQILSRLYKPEEVVTLKEGKVKGMGDAFDKGIELTCSNKDTPFENNMEVNK